MLRGSFVRGHRPSALLVFNLVASAILLAIVSLYTRSHLVTRLEEDVFRVVNDLPNGIGPFLFGVMQLGSYAAVFVAAAAAWLLRRRRLALELLLAGNIAYWLAVACKHLVGRARPARLLEHVHIRETIGGPLGYPSGHVAVATALGFTVARFVPRTARRYVWLVVTLVAIARIYVGAHLPIDAVGGFLVGWLANCLSQLVLGEDSPARSLAHLRQVLARKGIDVQGLDFLPGDARGSIPLRARRPDGPDLFIKVTSNEQRNADWLFKLYRRARYRDIEDETPFITAKQKSEHEAYMSLLVARAGVRTPRVVMTAVDEDGDAFLVQEFIPGETVDRLGAIDSATLADIWRQVSRLHGSGIAHRDLRAANLLVRGDEAYLIDLGFAEADAGEHQLARDLVELLVSTAFLAGAPASVGAAAAAVGCDALSTSLPYLQKAALSRAAREKLRQRAELLDELRAEITRQCGVGPVRAARLSRINRRNILWLIMLGLAVHFLLPQVGKVRVALGSIVHANPGWVVASLVASALTYLLSALIFQAAVRRRLPLRSFVLVQVASSFTNRLAPGAIGGLALAVRFLQKQGSSIAEAATAAAIARLGGAISAIALIPVLLLFARGAKIHVATAPKGLPILLTVVGVLLLITVVLAVPKLRRRGGAIAREVGSDLRAFATSGRVLRLLVLSFALTFAYGACLYFALLAVGLAPAIAHVLLVSIAGEGVGSAAPTPGGVGAVEAAMVSGLVIFGVPTAAAIAAVLIYRAMSFWLPIVPGFLAFQRLGTKGDI